jgi:DNA modification methylase
MGSGSTGVACVNTSRNFVGIELNDKYFDIAKTRILDAEQSAEVRKEVLF